MLMLILILTLKHFIKHVNGKYQKINIKNRTYYFFDDMINIKKFDSSLLKLDKKL